MLKYKGSWRFTPPPDGKRINQTIPQGAIKNFYVLISKIATQGNQQAVLEHFKGAFYRVKGIQYVRSTNLRWAETDLLSSMESASDNAPLFLEAFYEACVTFSNNNPDIFVPDIEVINTLCAENNIGYEIRPPNLILLESDVLPPPHIFKQVNVFDTHGQETKPPYPKAFLKIFLCHSTSDKPKVRELYHKLRKDGFNPWLDEEDLLPGQDWQQEIPNAVKSSDIVLICLSKLSINKIGYVQKEIKYALDIADEQPDGTIFLIPAKLEECDVPERLKKWHWVNLFGENGYQHLMRSLNVRATIKNKY